ncbi:hypothetical protein SMUE_02000 [Enterococcus cecorum]
MKQYNIALSERFKKEFRNLDNYIQVVIVSFLYKFISIFSFQKNRGLSIIIKWEDLYYVV